LRDVGEPYLEGFRVNVATREGEAPSDFPTGYFKALVTQASTHFVERGKLQKGDRVRFLAAAFRGQQAASNGSKVKFTTEEVALTREIKDAPLSQLLGDSVPHGTIDAGDVPVFVPTRVLEEATSLSRDAGMKETGGILIGHLYRDAGLPEIFAGVTAQIHARHTEADLTKLTFTAQTWTEVQAAIDLRHKNEIMLGWWHSHPVREWCKDCAPERQKVCAMATDFFSSHDQALHRTVFPSAYSIALVANDLVSDVTFSAFGWREGLIESRGFYINRASNN
jgi:proteasome lid subunit RPN8/RPN11